MKRLKQNPQLIIYIGISFLILLGIIYFFWIIPRQTLQDYKPLLQPKEYVELENSIRTGLAQAVGGVAILIGLFFTWRNIRATEKNLKITQETTSKNLALSQEGQITDRFTRAVEQLGNDKLQVRLGGIYALERIARDSKSDYWSVIEILSAFVRANTHSENALGSDETEVPADIQAVINVLSKRISLRFAPSQ